MDRRDFLSSSAMLAAASTVVTTAGSAGAAPRGSGAGVATALKGPLLDLSTQRGCREAWARLAGNTDMRSTKHGWYSGIVQGVRPGEALTIQARDSLATVEQIGGTVVYLCSPFADQVTGTTISVDGGWTAL